MNPSAIPTEKVLGLLPDHVRQRMGDVMVKLTGTAWVARVPLRREEQCCPTFDVSSLLRDVAIHTPHPVAQRLNPVQHCGIRVRQIVTAQQVLQLRHCLQHVIEVSRVH